MDLSAHTLKEGQRFQLTLSSGKCFIGEVVRVNSSRRAALKVVHIQNWSNCGVGYEYGDEDVAREDYNYLPGQDRPVL